MSSDPKIPRTPVEEPGYTPDEIIPGGGDVDYPAGLPDESPVDPVPEQPD